MPRSTQPPSSRADAINGSGPPSAANTPQVPVVAVGPARLGEDGDGVEVRFDRARDAEVVRGEGGERLPLVGGRAVARHGACLAESRREGERRGDVVGGIGEHGGR